MPHAKPFGLHHCFIGGVVFVICMVITFFMHLSIRIAGALNYPDPVPFFIWTTLWYLLITGVVWVVDMVGS